MDRYVSIRTNWSSIDSNSLERVCDVNIEENHQSTMMENDEESKLRLVKHLGDQTKIDFDDSFIFPVDQ